MKRFCPPILLAALVIAGGCTPQSDSQPGNAYAERADVQMRLLVVDDPAMAAAIGQLRSEWKARAGATVSISEATSAELTTAAALPGPVDAIIYPSGLLGLLAEREWVAPLPADYTANRELNWADTFELSQVAETAWGGTPYAVPFGSPVLTCVYRADLFERFHKSPPTTWQEYQAAAAFFAKRENLADAAPAAETPWFGAIEPLAAGWRGKVLLARASAYARHRDHYSTLFQIDSMEPLIGGPPFVRALEELVAAARVGPPQAVELDPAAARRELLAGHAALALAWPGHSVAGAEGAADESRQLNIGFVELPGAAEVYNFKQATWGRRTADESGHVPVLCLAGRLGSIAQQASHPAPAFQLLAWLSGQWAEKVSAASPATTLFRHSQIRAPRVWLDPNTDTKAAAQYAASVRDALSRQAYLLALRIPGEEKYFAALDAAVEHAIAGKQTPAEALAEAAAQWAEITNQAGLDAQRKAYRKSLGLDP